MAGEPRQGFTRHDRNENRFRAYPAPVGRQYRIDDLRLDGEDHGLGDQLARQGVSRGMPFHTATRSKPERRPLGLDNNKASGCVAGHPAAQHGRPHLAAADQNEAAAGSVAHVGPPLAQASPTGSIIADAIA